MAIEPIRCILLENGYTTQESASCCNMRVSQNVEINNYKKFIESKIYKFIKQDMDNGKWNIACSHCERTEKSNGISMRLSHNVSMRLSHNDFLKFDDSGLKHLTVNVGSECNLQCRSCGPWLSSSWEKEIKLDSYYNRVFSKFVDGDGIKLNYDLENEDLSNIEYVHFLGGEPLYNKKTLDILEKLYNQTKGNCKISMSTNGTVKLDFEKYHFLEKFKIFDLVLSIDAIDKQAEFIRTGCKWNKVNSVVDFYKDFKFINLGCHITHSVLNIFEYKKIWDWLDKKGIYNSELTTFVEQPSHLSFHILTPQEKKLYKELTNNPDLQFVYDRMDSEQYDPVLRGLFFEYMEVTKKIHEMDWKNYLPDLYNLMHQKT